MKSLAQKVAIVTGASSGIGRAAALLFAREGARLVISGRDSGRLDELVAAIRAQGGEALACPGDVREDELDRRLVKAAVEAFGGLDIAFNNAGAVGPMAPVPEIGLDDWRAAIDTNLTAAFLGARHQLPAMVERGGGSLIFTSTFVGHSVGFPGMGAYAASKAGLIGLVQTIAAEFGPQRIRANALLPGGTDTPMGRSVASTPEARSHVESLHALKRLAEPEEIARAALYLASDASSFMTGAAMLVDGGASISRS